MSSDKTDDHLIDFNITDFGYQPQWPVTSHNSSNQGLSQ